MMHIKWILYLAALLAGIAYFIWSGPPAHAYTPMDCAGLFCSPRTLNPDARIQNLPEIRDPNVTDSDRVLWVERCKPRRHFDGLTIRWLYAERGCEAGPMHLE